MSTSVHLDQDGALESAEAEAALFAEKISEAIEVRSQRFARVMLERAATIQQDNRLRGAAGRALCPPSGPLTAA